MTTGRQRGRQRGRQLDREIERLLDRCAIGCCDSACAAPRRFGTHHPSSASPPPPPPRRSPGWRRTVGLWPNAPTTTSRTAYAPSAAPRASARTISELVRHVLRPQWCAMRLTNMCHRSGSRGSRTTEPPHLPPEKPTRRRRERGGGGGGGGRRRRRHQSSAAMIITGRRRAARRPRCYREETAGAFGGAIGTVRRWRC